MAALPATLRADCTMVDLETGMVVSCEGADPDGAVTGAGDDVIMVATDAAVSRTDAKTSTIGESARTTTICAGAGDDRISNSGEVTATARVATDAADLWVAPVGGPAPYDGIAATAAAAGVDGGAGRDVFVNDGTVSALAEGIITAGAINLELYDLTRVDASLTAAASAIGLSDPDGIDIANSGAIRAAANASILAWSGEVNSRDWAAADLTATPLAAAVGIAGGRGLLELANTGEISASALAGAMLPLAEINAWDLAVAGAGIGTKDDPMAAMAAGIATGLGGSHIVNAATGRIIAEAQAMGTIDSLILSLYDFTIASDLLDNTGSIATYLGAFATGIDGGPGDDVILNAGGISAHADALTLALSLGVGAEGVPSGVLSTDNFLMPAGAGITTASGTVDTSSSEGLRGATGISGGAGRDTILNLGSLTAAADATATSSGLSISFPLLELAGIAKWWNDIPPAVALTTSGTSAEAHAAGITAGAGDDAIVSIPPAGKGIGVTATAIANTNQTALVLQNLTTAGGGPPYYANLDLALANAGAEAAAQASGLDGEDGHDAVQNQGALAVTAEATAVGNAASVSVVGLKGMTGLGAALVEAKVDTQASAAATGLEGGTGDDTVANRGPLAVDAHAFTNSLAASVSVQGEMKGVGLGAAFADADADATARAIGMTGGDGADILVNSAGGTEPLHAHADAEAYAESFAVTVQGTSTGVEIGGALATGTTTAATEAVAMDGGAGGDDILNEGWVESLAEAFTNNLAVGVDLQASAKGLGLGVALTDASATGRAVASGIAGGAGDDGIRNTAAGTVQARADADTYAELLSATVQGASTGVVLGGALALADSRASAGATGISGGAGQDNLLNEGLTDVNAAATANSLAVGATIAGAVSGISAQAAVTDTSTFATAAATGLAGNDGRDTITNISGATVRSTADARAYAESLTVTIQGHTTGVALTGALARSETAPTASAAGISGGAGNDGIVNDGLTDVSATTDSTSVSVSARVVGLIEGLSVGASLTDTSTTAGATALGLDGGDGNDRIGNGGTVRAKSDVALRAASVSFDFGGVPIGVSAGAALAESTTIADGNATGIRGGAGDDTLVNTNTGVIDVNALGSGTATAVSVSANTLGAAWSDTATTTRTRAVGMDGGDGRNRIANHGSLSANSHATGTAGSYAIQIGVGGGSARAGTNAEAAARGLRTGAGANTVFNEGTISVTAESDLSAENVSFTLAGVASAEAASTATSDAAGIDAGEGRNTIVNDVGGRITALADAEAKATNVAVVMGVAGVDGTTTATARSAGIWGGNGADDVINHGELTASAKVHTATVAGSISLAGIAAQEAAPGALAEGIATGGGNDMVLNTGSITAGYLGADPMVHAEVGGVCFLSLVNFSDSQFAARAEAAGISTGAGNDTVINQGAIHVGGDDWMALGTVGAFTIEGITFFDMTSVSARAETVSTGIQGGEGADILTNDTAGEITVQATSYSDATGSVDILLFGAPAAFAGATTQAGATGIGGGAGADWIRNLGTLEAEADTRADATATAWVGWGSPFASSGATAVATATGLDGGEGLDRLGNSGRLSVMANAEANAEASADTDIAANRSEAESTSRSEAWGIQAGDAGENPFNSEGGTIAVTTSSGGLSKAVSDENARARSVFTADAAGIQTGTGVHATLNQGQVTVTAAVNVDSHAVGSSNTAAAEATSRSGGGATATGIGAGEGENALRNDGDLTVIATNTAHALSNYPDAHLDHAYAYAGAGGITAGAEARGVAAGSGDNTVWSQGGITVSASLDATAQSHANTTRATNDAKSYAGGTAAATGITVGDGRNAIGISGDTTVTAVAQADALGYGEDYGWAHIGDETTAGLDAGARGVAAGGGVNTIVNSGAMQVTATADAYSLGSAHTFSDDPHGRAVAHARSEGMGIAAGDGGNTIINDGLIQVTARADARAEVSVDSTFGDEHRYTWHGSSARAVGILTGSGDDYVANHGTITTTQVADGAAFPGTAIFTGAGNDRVVLGVASTATGSIELGEGDDTLVFIGTEALGTAAVNGAIDPGNGSNSLVFDGTGSLGHDFAGFTNATKQGAGAFTLEAGLPTMRNLAVNEGTLHLAVPYTMAGDSAYHTVIRGDGGHGRLSVSGAAVLDGALTVSKDGGFFVNGTTYDIITAGTVENAFDDVALPDFKPLLRFELKQMADRVRIGARTKPFASLASDPVQRAVADCLDRIQPAATGDLRETMAGLQNLEAAPIRAAYSRMSPAPHDLFTQASHHGARLTTDILQRRMTQARRIAGAGPSASAAEPILLAMAGDVGPFLAAGGVPERMSGNGLWISGLDQWGTQKADDGFPGYDFDIRATAIGWDHTWNSRVTLGMTASLGSIDLDLNEDAGDGAIETATGTVYGSYFTRNAYVEGAVTYGRNDYDIDRAVAVGAVRRMAEGDHDGDVFAAFLGGGYGFDLGSWSWGPDAALCYVHLDEEAFTETGAGGMNLTIEGRRTESLVAEAGLRVARRFETAHGRLIPELRVALNYDFGIDDRAITAAFEGAPAVAFTTDGQDVEPLGFVTNAGLTWMTAYGIEAELKYTGEFREGYEAHGIVGQVHWSF
ncbi:MAG: autotransporter domain-containing protein [Desulfobacterales bacterium]